MEIIGSDWQGLLAPRPSPLPSRARSRRCGESRGRALLAASPCSLTDDFLMFLTACASEAAYVFCCAAPLLLWNCQHSRESNQYRNTVTAARLRRRAEPAMVSAAFLPPAPENMWVHGLSKALGPVHLNGIADFDSGL
jgi:hypothetical protein